MHTHSYKAGTSGSGWYNGSLCLTEKPYFLLELAKKMKVYCACTLKVLPTFVYIDDYVRI